jgi:hypothetical protein
VALVITDVVICIVGLVLMPREVFRPAGPLLAVTARAMLATAVMAIPVWFLHSHFLIAVPVGVAVFAIAATALGVFRGEGYAEAWAGLRVRLFRRFSKSTGAGPPEAASTDPDLLPRSEDADPDSIGVTR